MNEFTDILALLTAVAYLVAMAAISTLVWLIQRRVGGIFRTAVAMSVAATLYILGLALDVGPGVMGLLSNGAADVPLSATARTGMAALWMWCAYAVMLHQYNAVRGRP